MRRPARVSARRKGGAGVAMSGSCAQAGVPAVDLARAAGGGVEDLAADAGAEDARSGTPRAASALGMRRRTMIMTAPQHTQRIVGRGAGWASFTPGLNTSNCSSAISRLLLGCRKP